MMTYRILATAAAREAEERELCRRYGQGIGLSDEETQEVVTAWVAWHRTSPQRIDWTNIRNMLARRALGKTWEPAEGA
jgi:hypothetical protein